MKKYKNKIFIIIFIVFTAFSIIYTFSDEKYEEPKQAIVKEEALKKDSDKNKDEKVFVDIKGLVVNPGVYELTNKNNVNDAINVAGGLTENSDTSNINLSKKLSDEMVIIIYSKEQIRQMKESKKIECSKVNDACIKEADEKGKLDEEKTEEEVEENSGLVNINSADKENLMKLEGIGESKAKAIVEYREKNGNFDAIEDIKKVSGIGEAAFEKIKDSITV